MASPFQNLSDYGRKLGREQKVRYAEKNAALGSVDPYSLLSLDDLPQITRLDAFTQFASGWIEEIKATKTAYCFCVIGKVRNSVSVNIQ